MWPSNYYSVLVIDDDVTTIKLIAESLRSEFDVRFATTATDGLTIAEKSPLPDVILLDVMMPTMNGFEVCKRLKQNSITRDIPIIFVSSKDKSTEQQLGFELGATDYVSKPIEVPLLLARTRTHARMRQYIIQLEGLATTDPLTSCANRRKFDEVFDLQIRKAFRSQEPFSLIMLDIDDFKAYNDHYGHGKGDECLVTMGNILISTAHRAEDLPARLGGEEFALILPNTDEKGVMEIAKQIFAKLQEANIIHEYSSVKNRITVSMGYGVFYPEPYLKNDELLDQVDQALYRAKHEGKNKIKSVSDK